MAISYQSYEAALGSDIACFNDIFGDFRIVSGTTNLLYALARRLTCPELFYDPEYGMDLNDYINCTVDSAILAEIRSKVIAECKKDERVSGCSANVSYNAATEAISIAISVSSTIGSPFKFILEISKVSVSLLSIS